MRTLRRSTNNGWTVTLATLVAEVAFGCHGGEVMFGTSARTAAAGHDGQAGSDVTAQGGTSTSLATSATSAVPVLGGSGGTSINAPQGGSVDVAGAHQTSSSLVSTGGATGTLTSAVSTGGANVPTGGGRSIAGATALGGSGGNTANASGGASSAGATVIAGAPAVATTLPLHVKLVTSAQGAYWNTDASWTEATTSAVADITVDDSTMAQSWDGFGGAFNELGWSYLTTQALQEEALNLLFGADGCRFALGRIPIGASDYAMDRYTLDETPGDYTLANFSLDRDRQRLIPYVRAALAINPQIRLWASPWTPPTWMKSGQKTGLKPSPFDGGSMRDDDAILKTYAQYLIKFVQGYAAEGIPIETISPQNEPNNEENYPSCLWATPLYTKFFSNYLAPAVANAGLGVRIMFGTLSNGSADPAIVTSVMGDAAARSHVGVVGMQWGMFDVIASVRPKLQGFPVWQTEHKCGNYPWVTGYQSTAPNDHIYAVESWSLIRDWIKAGVNGYNAWNMVLDKSGRGIDTTRDWSQNALLIVDGGKIIKTPAYYVFRHLSQFVVPGSRLVAVTSVDALAFKNPDGSIVTVLFNLDAAKKIVLAVGGKKLQFELPTNGWATVEYQP